MTQLNHPLLILPGLGTSGPSHWQSLWQQRFPGAARIQQGDWEQPRCAAWCERIEDAVSRCASAPLIVAHSLGCLTLAHWARHTSRPLAGALLVAVPDPTAPSFPAQAQGFAPVPRGPLAFPSVVVASSNDPYASVQFARACAASWQSRFVSPGAAGHLNAASGVGQWGFGLELLHQLDATRRG